MGTTWAVSLWDEIDDATFQEIRAEVIGASETFDQTYSRFIASSLVCELAATIGIAEVPEDLMNMLRLYERLFRRTDGRCNPLVGFSLSDLGYDAEYSLHAKEGIRPTPDFSEALRIVDDGHIELREPMLIDVGALGKGYFLDRIAELLKTRGIRHFLADGSGDIVYQGPTDIRAGMEHPDDPAKVIGVVTMNKGSLCASGGNRRAWGGRHHIIDPASLNSPNEILATWVLAESAAISDGLATCLFLCDPEPLLAEWTFEYCILNSEYKVKRSAGFPAELF
jgi:FAD:protein FMN transferase